MKYIYIYLRFGRRFLPKVSCFPLFLNNNLMRGILCETNDLLIRVVNIEIRYSSYKGNMEECFLEEGLALRST